MNEELGIIKESREIIEDLSFSYVSKWKKENKNGLAIGYMPVYVPRPLLEAVNCIPVGIFGGGDQIDIIKGDSFFQSYICHIPRSTIELAVNGNFDVFDAILFPSICDVIRNLSGMFKILFPNKYFAYLDLPQNFSKKIGGKFYIEEMARICNCLEKIGASKLDKEKLIEKIKTENKRRDLINEIEKIRIKNASMVKASEMYTLLRVGTIVTSEHHIAILLSFLSSLKNRKIKNIDNVKVILSGGFCEQPPIALIKTLELAGCDIVNDDFQLGMRFIKKPISVKGDPITSLAKSFIADGSPTASRYIGEEKKGDDIIKQVKHYNADGVIFSAASFCDPSLLEQPMLERALGEANIPFTSFKYSENTGQFNVIKEQAGAFSDSIKLWGSK